MRAALESADDDSVDNDADFGRAYSAQCWGWLCLCAYAAVRRYVAIVRAFMRAAVGDDYDDVVVVDDDDDGTMFAPFVWRRAGTRARRVCMCPTRWPPGLPLPGLCCVYVCMSVLCVWRRTVFWIWRRALGFCAMSCAASHSYNDRPPLPPLTGATCISIRVIASFVCSFRRRAPLNHTHLAR